MKEVLRIIGSLSKAILRESWAHLGFFGFVIPLLAVCVVALRRLRKKQQEERWSYIVESVAPSLVIFILTFLAQSVLVSAHFLWLPSALEGAPVPAFQKPPRNRPKVVVDPRPVKTPAPMDPYTPSQEPANLLFKNRPELTPTVQAKIRRNITLFHAYLAELGFENVKGPLVISVGENVLTIPAGLTEAHLDLPASHLTDDKFIDHAYAMEFFAEAFPTALPLSRESLLNNDQVRSLYSDYFVASFADGTSLRSTPWLAFLSKLRAQEGRSYTDKLMYITYLEWNKYRPTDPFNVAFARLLEGGVIALETDPSDKHIFNAVQQFSDEQQKY